MKDNDFKTGNFGVGTFATCLTLLLIILKLGGVGIVTSWSWWLVFAPLLLVVCLWVFVLAVSALIALLFWLVTKEK